MGLTASAAELRCQEPDAAFACVQIIENTPENHPDHSHLKQALEKAEELCSQVNEGVREKENSDRLEWIQAHVQCEGLSEVTGLPRGQGHGSTAPPGPSWPLHAVLAAARAADPAGCLAPEQSLVQCCHLPPALPRFPALCVQWLWGCWIPLQSCT